jgi:hypothetical protein
MQSAPHTYPTPLLTAAPCPLTRHCALFPALGPVLQLVGFVLKISCATPVLGPTMGLVGVGLANVLAGQASKHTRKMVVMKSHPLQPGFWEAPNPEDLVLDAVMGACIFKVGHRTHMRQATSPADTSAQHC